MAAAKRRLFFTHPGRLPCKGEARVLLNQFLLRSNKHPRVKRVVFQMRAKPFVPRSRVKRVSTVCQPRGDCYLPPVNGPHSLIVSCSPISSSFSWFLMYSAIRLVFFPVVST